MGTDSQMTRVSFDLQTAIMDNVKDDGQENGSQYLVCGAATVLACTGECDNDGQCSTGRTCFQRSNGEGIPGCTGNGGGNDWDYCYYPALADDKKEARYQAYERDADIWPLPLRWGNYALQWTSGSRSARTNKRLQPPS